MTPKELGVRLRNARLAANLTQLDVAIRVHLARSSVSMIENGTRPLRDGELTSLSKLYQVDEERLSGRNG